MSFEWSRAYAIARKEIFHIVRDPFTVALALVWPVAVVLLFGFAMDFNIKNIPTTVHDADQSQSSRLLVEAFGSSQYFLIRHADAPWLATREIDAERARAAIIIPPAFQQDLLSGRGARAQLMLDGADNSTIGPLTSYVNRMQTLASERLSGQPLRSPVELRTRFLFNPELNSRWFTIPGLAVVVMSILSVLMTALTVAREWENGSMEMLLSTPVQPLEIIVGKLAPYGLLGLGAVALVYLIARGVFDVPFAGSHLLFLIGCILFLSTYLAQGLLISVITRKQVIAMQVAMISGLLPSQLLSGFVFPIESMPPFFRYFTAIFPARWFMAISRDAFLEGSTLSERSLPYLALLVANTVMIALAARKFKKDLEP